MPPKTLPICLFTATLIASGADARSGVKTQDAARDQAEEQTCGQEIAASAEVPRRWQELMTHVATNMEWHATWVGAASSGAQQERDALMRVAREYRAMASTAGRAAAAMRGMRDVAPVPHDPSKLNREGQARWMRTKIQMQRQFAALLTRHAEDSERALAELESRNRR